MKPKIHIVPLSKFPQKAQKFKNLKGYQTKDHVYILKGVPDAEAIKYHETYHFIKKHPDHPKSPKQYMRHELEADIYANKKTGQHKHIKPQMKAVMNDVIADYKLPASKVVRMMASEVRKKDIPKTYKRDFNHLMRTQTYKGRKLPKDVRVDL